MHDRSLMTANRFARHFLFQRCLGAKNMELSDLEPRSCRWPGRFRKTSNLSAKNNTARKKASKKGKKLLSEQCVH